MKKFARWAEDTNKGINEGFVFGDGERYFETKEGLENFLAEIGHTIDSAYESDLYYHTEWELEDDNYFLEDGTEVEL